jgi:hypothetical protein
MKIHTNKITPADLKAATPKGCHLQAVNKGSRSHAYAYEISMSATPGHDSRGCKRRYAASSETTPGYNRSATWTEWGDMFAHLFALEPGMKAGPYEDADSFMQQTQEQARFRDEREDARSAADEWADQIMEGSMN